MASIIREAGAIAAAAAAAACDLANQISGMRLDDPSEVDDSLIQLLKSTVHGKYNVDNYVVAKTKSGIVVQTKIDYDNSLPTGLYIRDDRVKVLDSNEVPTIKRVIRTFLFGDKAPDKDYAAADLKSNLEKLVQDANATETIYFAGTVLEKKSYTRTYFERQLFGTQFDVKRGGGNSMPASRMGWPTGTVQSERLPFMRLISLTDSSLNSEQRKLLGYTLDRLHTVLEPRKVLWDHTLYGTIDGLISSGRWQVSTTEEANVAISKLFDFTTFIESEIAK